MKKLILLLIISIANIGYAQLALKDDSITVKNESPNNGKLDSNKFKELNGFSKYSGTIQGFSSYCKYDLNSQKLFYNNFTNKISLLNLTKEENDMLNNSFKSSANEVKKTGIPNLTCDKFKQEFDKIISTLK